MRRRILPFYGYNRLGVKVSEGARKSSWLQGRLVGLMGQLDRVKHFSETDFTEDLKRIEVPVLVVHGDDDQIVPVGASAMLSSKLLKNGTLKICPGADHRLSVTHQDKFNTDLLAFIRGLS